MDFFEDLPIEIRVVLAAKEDVLKKQYDLDKHKKWRIYCEAPTQVGVNPIMMGISQCRLFTIFTAMKIMNTEEVEEVTINRSKLLLSLQGLYPHGHCIN
jgi:hypothetical protein